MRRILFCAACAAVVTLMAAPNASAQSRGSIDAKTNAIAASFSKFKSLSKEKHGIKKEKYLKVESQPAVLPNAADYSGKYEVPDLHMSIDLRVNRDGTFTGSGYEELGDGVMRTFTLRDGKIDRAFLSATKVYANASQSFEGAFMNRSTYESPTDKGVTVFGFGTIGRAIYVNGYTTDKFFFQKVE